MNSIITNSSTRLTALTLSVIAVVAFAFAAVQVAPAHAASICPGTTWSVNLKQGSTGPNVLALQQFLNMSPDTVVASSGPGSPGNETSYFGGLTRAAVNKFQQKYAAQVLAPVGLSTPTGNFFTYSRAEANALCAGSTVTVTPPGTIPGTVSGTATITASAQPANTLAPANSARVPFTAFTVSANGSPVTINSVSVVRQGPSLDTDFSGVELINASTGVQVGISRVLDSNHSATIGSPITIAAGTSQTFWVAANVAALPGSGDIASFAVTAVNTNSTVSGSLPITGASNTLNSSLTIGTATIQSSSFDPNSASSQPIGTSAYRFTGFRIQAGSVEDLTFRSVTWYQSGSASGLQNVVTVVNGTSYPTTLDSTGRYYTAVFPTGIVIPKGASVDVYVQGDLGSNTTANTTAEFDIYRNTDIYLTGNTYGFGITPSGAGTFGGGVSGSICSTTTLVTCFLNVSSANPYLRGSTVTVTAGTFSTIQNATSVGAQNIALNVSNQPLGGFQTNLTGEAITVQSLKIHFNSSGVMPPLTNVSLVNQNGSIVSGPYNATCDSGTTVLGANCATVAQTVTFTGSILFPTGSNTYTIQGQVPSATANGTTIQASTNPTSDWTSVTGNTTGNNITIGVTNFTMSTMTVKSATLTVANSTSPTAQSIVAGGSNVLLAGLQLDASQSGENIRLSSLPVTLTVSAAANVTTDLSACQLFNGTTPLNTGSRVINGSNLASTTSQTVTFNFDNSLTVPKGTVLTLGLQCNLSSSANTGATYQFSQGTPTATGAVSGNTAVVTLAAGAGPVMTATTGATLTVSTDASSPSYTLVAGGTTGVTANVIKFHATNEGVNLQKVGLTLTNVASSSPADLTQVYLYAGNNIWTTSGVLVSPGTLLGTATFTGNATVATSTLNTVVQLPNNTDATIVIKADIAQIGINQPGTEGHLVAIDYANSQGVGANSGKNIFGTVGITAGTGAAGLRTFRTIPTVALDTTLPGNGVADGRLLEFKVTANSSGPVGIAQFAFSISTTTATVTNVQLFAYTDSGYSQSVSGTFGASTGQFGSTVAGVNNGVTFNIAATTNPVEVAAGSTYYFQLKGSVSAPTNSSVVTTLKGDAAYPALGAGQFMGQVSTTSIAASNLIWSPNATTTNSLGGNDYTNGFGILGLPSGGLFQTRSN